MVAHVATVAFLGLEARGVEVQVQIAAGLPKFLVVGLPDKAVGESRERVHAALAAIGLALPPKRITVNLSPADLPKEGSHYDLPIALGLLAAMGAIDRETLASYLAVDRTHRREQAERDRQIVMRAFLGQIRGREIDRDPLRRQRQPDRGERGMDPLAALPHRLVRQADDEEFGQSCRDLHLNLDAARLQEMATSDADSTVRAALDQAAGLMNPMLGYAEAKQKLANPATSEVEKASLLRGVASPNVPTPWRRTSQFPPRTTSHPRTGMRSQGCETPLCARTTCLSTRLWRTHPTPAISPNARTTHLVGK